MIGLGQLLVCILTGSAAILIGLVPGLFQGLIEGVQTFRDELISPARFTQPRIVMTESPIWFARLGMVWIALGLLAYFLN